MILAGRITGRANEMALAMSAAKGVARALRGPRKGREERERRGREEAEETRPRTVLEKREYSLQGEGSGEGSHENITRDSATGGFSESAPFSNTCAKYWYLKCSIWRSCWRSIWRPLGGVFGGRFGASASASASAWISISIDLEVDMEVVLDYGKGKGNGFSHECSEGSFV